MTRDDILLLYEYDRWANQRLLDSVASLSAEQFTRDLGGSFPAVRDVLLHIVSGKWSWLTYWKEPAPSDAILKQVWPRASRQFAAPQFPDFAALGEKWAEIDAELDAFLNHPPAPELDRVLPVCGKPITLAHLIQHLFNHGSYHRGQVNMMLRQLGAAATCVDFAEFLLSRP